MAMLFSNGFRDSFRKPGPTVRRNWSCSSQCSWVFLIVPSERGAGMARMNSHMASVAVAPRDPCVTSTR